MEDEHLQRCYQHLLDQSPNQPEQTISNNQCNNEYDVTKRNEVIESYVLNPELNKDTRPLSEVPSCQVLPDHPFPKGTCLIVGET